MLIHKDDLSLQIMSVIRVNHDGGRFSVAARPYAALSIRLFGRGNFEVGGEHLSSEAGDILFIPANTPYEAEYTVTEMIVVHLTGCNYYTPEVISAKNPSVAESHFEKMLTAWEEKRSVNYVKSKIYALLDALARENSTAPEGHALTRCIEYMDAHFSECGVNIDSICRATYVCRSTMQRQFKSRLGTSPQQYLTRLRLEHALTLLAVERLPVSDAARASGFSDEKYFSRAFKRRYGFSPSEARRSMML